jgi:hypothetical protein
MKALIYSALPVFLIAFLVFSCEKDKDNNSSLTLTGKLINMSACKNLKSDELKSSISDTLTCINYHYDDTINTLTIKHINAGFNCCFDSVYCHVSIINDTIVIQEIEKDPNCYCDCLFDLDIEVSGVVLKKYQIRFIEPYSGEQEKIKFELDLTKQRSGSYCVTRKLYPWGM